MDYGFLFVALACVFGLFMAWGVGANDVANAMSTSVGSRAITVKQAIIIAAIFEFAGAYLAGGEVTTTIRNGMLDTSSITDTPEILVFGMLGSLLHHWRAPQAEMVDQQGRAGCAIDVVVTVNRDLFAALHSLCNALSGRIHVAKFRRVGQKLAHGGGGVFCDFVAGYST